MAVTTGEYFDNSARDHAHITVSPLASAMGAEITGVNVADVSDAAFAEIENALFRHKMIFFRDQALTPGQQEAFSARFGPFAEDAYTEGVAGHRHVQPVVKEADKATGWVFGSGWHTDSPFLPDPPAISILYGVDIPPYGGDTMWANTALAYRFLSDGMKAILEPLKVHMSMRDVLISAQRHGVAGDDAIGRLVALRGAAELPERIQRQVAGAFHPLVRTHPRTGEKGLYVDGSYAVGIEGLTDAEAGAILSFLVAHMTQPAFTCRLRWSPGTLALWDNRLCIHQAFNDYDGFRREMYRTTIAGERPA